VNEDIRVRVFGDVAVATACGMAKGRYKGQDPSGQFRYTRIWVKRNGQWQAWTVLRAPGVPSVPLDEAGTERVLGCTRVNAGYRPRGTPRLAARPA
jgi:hypothetical protein